MHYDLYEIISCASLRPFKVYFRQVSYFFSLIFWGMPKYIARKTQRSIGLGGLGKGEQQSWARRSCFFLILLLAQRNFGRERKVEIIATCRRDWERERGSRASVEPSGSAVGFRVFALPTQLCPLPSANPSIYVCHGEGREGRQCWVGGEQSRWQWA